MGVTLTVYRTQEDGSERYNIALQLIPSANCYKRNPIPGAWWDSIPIGSEQQQPHKTRSAGNLFIQHDLDLLAIERSVCLSRL